MAPVQQGRSSAWTSDKYMNKNAPYHSELAPFRKSQIGRFSNAIVLTDFSLLETVPAALPLSLSIKAGLPGKLNSQRSFILISWAEPESEGLGSTTYIPVSRPFESVISTWRLYMTKGSEYINCTRIALEKGGKVREQEEDM